MGHRCSPCRKPIAGSYLSSLMNETCRQWVAARAKELVEQQKGKEREMLLLRIGVKGWDVMRTIPMRGSLRVSCVVQAWAWAFKGDLKKGTGLYVGGAARSCLVHCGLWLSLGLPGTGCLCLRSACSCHWTTSSQLNNSNLQNSRVMPKNG